MLFFSLFTTSLKAGGFSHFSRIFIIQRDYAIIKKFTIIEAKDWVSVPLGVYTVQTVEANLVHCLLPLSTTLLLRKTVPVDLLVLEGWRSRDVTWRHVNVTWTSRDVTLYLKYNIVPENIPRVGTVCPTVPRTCSCLSWRQRGWYTRMKRSGTGGG